MKSRLQSVCNRWRALCVCVLTRYCMAMVRLRGPGGPMRNTSWPSKSFCMIHRRCWATVWVRGSDTGTHVSVDVNTSCTWTNKHCNVVSNPPKTYCVSQERVRGCGVSSACRWSLQSSLCHLGDSGDTIRLGCTRRPVEWSAPLCRCSKFIDICNRYIGTIWSYSPDNP